MSRKGGEELNLKARIYISTNTKGATDASPSRRTNIGE